MTPRTCVLASCISLVAGVSGCGGAPSANTSTAHETAPAPRVAPPWQVPSGWRTETIPFPLEFAPSLGHQGVEELRFPPGFFEPGDAWFWSYAFVWYLQPPGPVGEEALARDLTTYFDGLARAVLAEQGGQPPPPAPRVVLHAASAGEVAGTLEVFDAFRTKAPIRLHLRGWDRSCAASGTRALVFVASPRARQGDREVWPALEALGQDFRCPG